jgi:hypothetical protein
VVPVGHVEQPGPVQFATQGCDHVAYFPLAIGQSETAKENLHLLTVRLSKRHLPIDHEPGNQDMGKACQPHKGDGDCTRHYPQVAVEPVRSPACTSPCRG